MMVRKASVVAPGLVRCRIENLTGQGSAEVGSPTRT
jgi:hypothetical protein